jgi:protein phosphatase
VDHVDEQNTNALANHIGYKEDIYLETRTWLLNRGDRWLLCSDGLTKGVTRAELTDVLATVPDPQEAVNTLISLANRTGEDNVTVLVVDVG